MEQAFICLEQFELMDDVFLACVRPDEGYQFITGFEEHYVFVLDGVQELEHFGVPVKLFFKYGEVLEYGLGLVPNCHQVFFITRNDKVFIGRRLLEYQNFQFSNTDVLDQVHENDFRGVVGNSVHSPEPDAEYAGHQGNHQSERPEQFCLYVQFHGLIFRSCRFSCV